MVYSQVPLNGEIGPLFLFDIRCGVEKPKITVNKPPKRHTHGRILWARFQIVPFPTDYYPENDPRSR